MLQQILDTEDPAEREGEDYTEDPVAEADIGELDRVMDGSDDEFSDCEEAEGMIIILPNKYKLIKMHRITIINYQHCRSGYDIDTEKYC